MLAIMPDFFTGGLWIKLWSSCLQGKCFTACLPAPAPFLSKYTTRLHFLDTVVLNVSLADQVFLGRQKTKTKTKSVAEGVSYLPRLKNFRSQQLVC